MADNYLEKRYDEVFNNPKPRVKRVGLTVDQLVLRNRSYRGYNKQFVVTRDMLVTIVSVCNRIPSARNQQVLRYYLVTRDTGADTVLANVRMGAALPELHLPLPGTEPEAFVIVCSTIAATPMVYIDLGIALQSMLLKAAELGLGGLIIQAFNHEAIRDAFALPCEPVAVMAIGKPAETVQLKPIDASEPHNYYRDNDVHIVPKIKLSELLLN